MMYRLSRTIVVLFLGIGLLSACNGIPGHARYIPNDAVAVAGINLRALSKKIAWNVITGSKLFKEMQARIPEKNTKDAMNSIEKSGIDFSNTLYVYIKTDNRLNGNSRVTGLVPLADAGQWEAYVKQVFPQVEIKQLSDRKEARLGSDMYVGWTKNLMIIINTMSVSANNADDQSGSSAKLNVSSTMGNTDVSAEMANAFSVTKENSIIDNKHFKGLELEGHDVTFWLNYDKLMSQYMGGNMAEKMGVTLSNTLWKDAAFTSGFDFRKGKITGDMHYYMSAEMKDAGTELGAKNVDKDMVERLPSRDMDMIMALHISPKGIKALLDKTGLLGLANVGLSTQGMNVDSVLDAFTGDMAIVMNDFGLHTETITDSFMGQAVIHQNQKPSGSLSYVLKINKKENFEKLFQLAKDNGIQQMGSGYIVPIDDKDSVYIMRSGEYAIASNKFANANGFLQGSFKVQKMPEPAASEILGHPWAIYFDMQQFLKNIDAGISHSAHDSAMISESKKLLNNISFTGGTFKENAFEYHLDINFMNTEENSIIELMDFGMKMNDADNIASK